MHPQNFTTDSQEYTNIFLRRKKFGQFMICPPASFNVGEVERSQIAQSVFFLQPMAYGIIFSNMWRWIWNLICLQFLTIKVVQTTHLHCRPDMKYSFAVNILLLPRVQDAKPPSPWQPQMQERSSGKRRVGGGTLGTQPLVQNAAVQADQLLSFWLDQTFRSNVCSR